MQNASSFFLVSLRQLSGKVRSGRSPSRVSPNRSHLRIAARENCRTPPRQRNRHARHRSNQCMGRSRSPLHESRKQRASRRRMHYRRRTGRTHRRHLHRHRAVMRSVPPAASRQTRVIAGRERPRQGPQPEEQHQQNGESAPHLTRMLHEPRLSSQPPRRTSPLTC